MIEQVRMVLVNTSHPGNIGAAARAMKNMGLRHLALVNPKQYPHADATARASGADDILENVSIFNSLEEAVADCHYVLATSARQRSLPWPMVSPRQAAEQVMAKAQQQQQVAIVFGNERVGLSNDELSVAQHHITIPTVEGFSSLNLAAAVQVIAYELYVQHLSDVEPATEEARELVSAEQMAGLMKHFQHIMTQTEFLDPNHPKLLMKRLQRLLHRASLDVTELNIMRGILSSVDNKLKTI